MEKLENGATQTQKNKKAWLRLLARLPWLLLYPLAIWLAAQAAKRPELVEKWFSRGAYPLISSFMGMISSWIPFSLAELLVYVLIFAVLALLTVFVVRLIQRRFSLVRAASLVLSLCIAGGVCLNLFYWLWGFNYSRPSLYALMDLPVRARRVEELESLCYALRDQAETLRTSLMEDEAGVYTTGLTPRESFATIPAAYERLGKKYGLFAYDVYPAKRVMASEAMSYGGIAGIFIPFTAEANVNAHQPDLLLLCGAAHESAHFLGIAREDEANFAAYLACINSGDPSAAYSGVMLALITCGNRLNDHDPEKYYALRASYGDALNRDLKDYDLYWKAYEGPVEEAVTDMNDNYLKFNQQESGVNSYGMMVDLLLAYYFKDPLNSPV